MSISIGSLTLRNRVILAPMSGVTDEAFRTVAHACGAGLVVSEMVASDALYHDRRDMVRRARGKAKLSPFVIQLAGREAHWMSEGAKIAQDLGADIIDINMGCPARQVTGGLSGSALMRDPDHALGLIKATVEASAVPVTVKMRLGWDHDQLNAPHIARRAEDAGVKMITVHGRTRCQFYKGKADWKAIRTVREAISIPLVANGDGASADDARKMMEISGADAVMFGRAAYGRPWWLGAVAHEIEAGQGKPAPLLFEERDLLLWLQDETLKLYGESLGNRTFRKHLGWTVDRLLERALLSMEQVTTLRASLLPCNDNDNVSAGIKTLFEMAMARSVSVAA
jgi:tRNA-dihydrouridine synthase B